MAWRSSTSSSRIKSTCLFLVFHVHSDIHYYRIKNIYYTLFNNIRLVMISECNSVPFRSQQLRKISSPSTPLPIEKVVIKADKAENTVRRKYTKIHTYIWKKKKYDFNRTPAIGFFLNSQYEYPVRLYSINIIVTVQQTYIVQTCII